MTQYLSISHLSMKVFINLCHLGGKRPNFRCRQSQSNIVCMSGWQPAWERRDRGENVAVSLDSSSGCGVAAAPVWSQHGRVVTAGGLSYPSHSRHVSMCHGCSEALLVPSFPQAPSHQNWPVFVDIFIQFSSAIIPAVTSNTLPHQREAPLRVFTCYFDGASPSQATICFILTGPSGTWRWY